MSGLWTGRGSHSFDVTETARRVAVTGLGAVTPLGNDVRSTWRAALAGESGIDWIRSFDPSALPVPIAAEVKGFDASLVASPKEIRKLDRYVLLALGAGRPVSNPDKKA